MLQLVDLFVSSGNFEEIWWLCGFENGEKAEGVEDMYKIGWSGIVMLVEVSVEYIAVVRYTHLHLSIS